MLRVSERVHVFAVRAFKVLWCTVAEHLQTVDRRASVDHFVSSYSTTDQRPAPFTALVHAKVARSMPKKVLPVEARFGA